MVNDLDAPGTSWQKEIVIKTSKGTFGDHRLYPKSYRNPTPIFEINFYQKTC